MPLVPSNTGADSKNYNQYKSDRKGWVAKREAEATASQKTEAEVTKAREEEAAKREAEAKAIAEAAAEAAKAGKMK